MGWLFLAPALFGIWKYRYFAYWRWVLWVGLTLYVFAALFWSGGTMNDPTGDGLITGAIRQASNDGPEVLWGLLALVLTVVICVLLLKRAHRTTKSPYPGGDAAKSASWPRKLAESVGLIAAVFFANLLLGGFLAYTQTQFYEVGPDIVHQDSFLSHLESDVLSSAAQINSSVPTQIDEITVLERASAEGTTLVYHYNIESSASPRDIEAAMAPRIFQGVCSDITMTAAMRDGASFRYEYTNTRAELASVEISESNCHPEMPIIPNGASASLAPSPNHE